MQTLFVEFGFAFFSGSGPPFCFDVKLLLLFEKVALIRPVIQIRIGISTLAQRMGGDNMETLDFLLLCTGSRYPDLQRWLADADSAGESTLLQAGSPAS
jgi:hypothetical protein